MHVRHRIIACLLVFLTVAPVRGVEISNRDLFNKSLKAAVGAFEHYGEHEEAAELERVTEIGYRLAAASGFKDFPFTFYLIDMPVPNAFALPGGQVFVTRGMLNLDLNDDMLACLLGHEIAHVTHRHGIRMQRRATLLNLVSQALVIGVLVGVDDEKNRRDPREPYDPYNPYGRERSRKGSLVEGTMATGLVVSELLLRNYSRDFEDEADDEGQRMAAGAGYDPDGARQLWELMTTRIPQSKAYGYWRTHPFSDERMRAANARAAELKIQEQKPASDYRAATQKLLLEHVATIDTSGEKNFEPSGEKQEDEMATVRFLERAALNAWPQGTRADGLRLDALHRTRTAELEKRDIARDYGKLARDYRLQIEAVRALTPESPFLATAERELADLRRDGEALYPKALDIFREGIFETPFLETFLSNYPTAEVVPEVALALGDAYSRLGRQGEAVTHYLRAAEAGPESEPGRKALRGLRNLTPHLEKMAALQELGDRTGDETLETLAAKRLGELAGTYKELANGAEYLRRFPEGAHSTAVEERLNKRAQEVYGEVLLYQAVGDSTKALEGIQAILTHAPLSPAADSLRDRAVLDS